MDNVEEIFKAHVDEGAVIRASLNAVEWKRMNYIKKIIGIIISRNTKTVSAINDAVHYRNGGYPNPNSPPRHVDACNRVADMFKYLNMIGRGGLINDYLESEYGLKLVITDPSKHELPNIQEIDEDKYNQLTELVEKVCPNVVVESSNVATVLEELVDIMDDQQTTICQMSNSIKNDLVQKVKSTIGAEYAKKSDFLTAVKMKSKELLKPNSGVKAKQKLVKDQDVREEKLNIVFPPPVAESSSE